ncbi:Zinc finger HIT domain-containing protein 2 [Linum grandiflorum]
MEQSIITSEKASQPSPLDPPSRIICHVCQKQFSQYTCPRCNSRYCSLQCYKSHSVRCTESFMRENVVGELKHLKTGDESKRKMMDILKRVHSEEEKIEAMDDDDGDGRFLFTSSSHFHIGCELLQDEVAEMLRMYSLLSKVI